MNKCRLSYKQQEPEQSHQNQAVHNKLGMVNMLIFSLKDLPFPLTGKGSGGLNLGNFFASRAGYSRKGFDRLSTEGSDQEKDEDDATDSEEEESAPPPPAIPPSS